MWVDGCPSRKRRYLTEREALDQLAELIRLSIIGARRTDAHGESAVYPCQICDGWHLTSQPKQANRIVQE